MRAAAPILLAAVLAFATPGLAASEAERIASRTGEVVGAASGCGIPEGEVAALGRKVIGWARDTARDAAELRRVQAAHEAAMDRGAGRIRRDGQGACAATVRAFRELEVKAR